MAVSDTPPGEAHPSPDDPLSFTISAIKIFPSSSKIESLQNLSSQSKLNQKNPIKICEQQPQLSYLQAAQGCNRPSGVSSSMSLQTELQSDSFPLKPISQFQGKPAVIFQMSDKKVLVDKLKMVLVGKFSHGMPRLNLIRNFFDAKKLQRPVSISMFDKKHVFIECFCKVDYNFIWLHLSWVIEGCTMRVLKWSADFNPVKECAIVPVWIRLESLPLYMFDEMSLLALANCVGIPIKVDPRNVDHSIVNSARVCVELDVSKPLLDSIWVNFEDDVTKVIMEGFMVKVFYDVVPPYCGFCSHLGHGLGICKRKKEIDVHAAVLVQDPVVVQDAVMVQYEEVVEDRQELQDMQVLQAYVGLDRQELHGRDAVAVQDAALQEHPQQTAGLSATAEDYAFDTTCSNKGTQQRSVLVETLQEPFLVQGRHESSASNSTQFAGLLGTEASLPLGKNCSMRGLELRPPQARKLCLAETALVQVEQGQTVSDQNSFAAETGGAVTKDAAHVVQADGNRKQAVQEITVQMDSSTEQSTAVNGLCGLLEEADSISNKAKHAATDSAAVLEEEHAAIARVAPQVKQEARADKGAVSEEAQQQGTTLELNCSSSTTADSLKTDDASAIPDDAAVAGYQEVNTAGNVATTRPENETIMQQLRRINREEKAKKSAEKKAKKAALKLLRKQTGSGPDAGLIQDSNTHSWAVLVEEEGKQEAHTEVEKVASKQEDLSGKQHSFSPATGSAGQRRGTEMGRTSGQIGGNAGVAGNDGQIVHIERLEQAGQVAGNTDFSMLKARMHRLTGNERYLAKELGHAVEYAAEYEGDFRDRNLQQNYLQSVLQGTVLQDACQFAKNVDLGLKEAVLVEEEEKQDVTEENNEIGLVKKEMQKIGEAERVRKSTAQEEKQLPRELKFVRDLDFKQVNAYAQQQINQIMQESEPNQPRNPRKNLKEYFMASAEKINIDLERKRSEKKEKTTGNSFKYGE